MLQIHTSLGFFIFIPHTKKISLFAQVICSVYPLTIKWESWLYECLLWAQISENTRNACLWCLLSVYLFFVFYFFVRFAKWIFGTVGRYRWVCVQLCNKITFFIRCHIHIILYCLTSTRGRTNMIEPKILTYTVPSSKKSVSLYRNSNYIEQKVPFYLAVCSFFISSIWQIPIDTLSRWKKNPISDSTMKTIKNLCRLFWNISYRQ